VRETDSMMDVLETRNLTAVEVDGRRYAVALRIHHDGIEYVGRLWFADDGWEDTGMPDRGPLPGRTPEEVWALASRLRPDELRQRYDRAVAEKRRFLRLRRVTDEMLGKVRFMNQVAIAMRAGLLDADGAAQEIELTERQLHELVDVLRSVAGIES
jgi:hypothetical protein